MNSLQRRLLLLGGVALLLVGCSGSSSHSLLYLHTAILERGHGSPQFSALAYVDDQLLGRYDRDTRQCLPQSSWMEEIAHDGTLLWDRSSGRKSEVQLTADLGVFKNLYNWSQRLHVLQMRYGCELTKDDHARGFMKYGYNGRGFLSLDQKTLTWTALEAEAKLIKQKWDAEPSRGKVWQYFVQETCVDWLRTHLHYGKAALLRNGSGGLILGVLLGVVAVAVLLGVGVAIYMKKCRGGYKEASTSEQESDSNAGAN